MTPFGIRTIEFSKDKGFLLNGKQHRFNGVCMHHDLGALGAAINRRALERQLEIMKSMGVNAIRTSHNPPAPELLELTDRMGLLVMDEAFDMWEIPKVRNGLSKYWKEWYDTDLREFVRRDRNHPSIVLWSIGNEIPEQGRPDGGLLAQKLVNIVHQEDRTRPTTAGFNNDVGAIKNELASAVDIPAFNYKPTKYAQILKDHPNWIIFASETSSAVSSRGVYHLPIEKYQKHPSLQLTSYDVIAPPWAYIPDVEFDAQEKNPQVLGEFVWTGFDYLGEPTPYFNGRGVGNDNDWPVAQFLLRHCGSRRLPEGPLLPLSEPLDHQADGPPAAALELGRYGRQADSGDVLHQRRRGGVVPQRQIAGPQEKALRTGGTAGGQ